MFLQYFFLQKKTSTRCGCSYSSFRGILLPLLLAFLISLSSVRTTQGYKILEVIHMASKSHHIVGSALLKELARRGHEVTMISPYPMKKPMANYTDIPTVEVIKQVQETAGNLLNYHNRSILESMVSFYDVGLKVTETVLNDPGVQKLIHSKQTFDVVICEVFLSEALYGLAEHFRAPLIGLGTFGAVLWNTDMVGSPSPPSYVPHPMLQFTDRMTLPQRVANLAFATFERLFTDFSYFPRQEALYRKYFPDAKRSLREVQSNTALVLLNQHVSLSFPRPYMPNHIEVGGMHINRVRQPLPADLQRFLDGAGEGAIYFSLGSNVKSKDLPAEKREAILTAIRGLKQRVLWKFEDPDLPSKPANLLIRDWFPQDDILAHPNIHAFITHGGLLSTTESIYHGKPFVGIPLFGDQFLNTGRAELAGYGLVLDYNQLTAASFTAAIRRLLEEPSYAQKVRDMSARYRDQPLEPLALAVHWVEHVVRHKGATYLRSAGMELNFWQYHNIDAILILYGGLLMALLAILLIIRAACCSVWRRCSSKSTAKRQTAQRKPKKQ